MSVWSAAMNGEYWKTQYLIFGKVKSMKPTRKWSPK